MCVIFLWLVDGGLEAQREEALDVDECVLFVEDVLFTVFGKLAAVVIRNDVCKTFVGKIKDNLLLEC